MYTWLATMTAVTLAVAISQSASCAVEPGALVGCKGVYDVCKFGAKGNGSSDDTAAFQKALDAAGKAGGGIVFVPTGSYLIKGHLSVPDHVCLEGVFRAPTARTQYKGSTLLAVEGRGNENGEPFIFLHANSILKGITVFYPEQDRKKPVAYPWCVRGSGDNASIVDVLLVNPWQAVDFGTLPCGRHLIRGLYAQPIKTGVFVDKCFDVGRIEDVHLWPFWTEELLEFTKANGTAFVFGRTDWEFVSGCFCISYKVGFRFTSFKDGPGNVVINNSGSDIGPCAVLVDDCQGHAGVVFTGCQFMAGIVIKETNSGPVKFSNCGFWGVEGVTTTHANIKGRGHTSFSQCHFTAWDRMKTGEPAIRTGGSGLTVTGCDFMDAGLNQIALEEGVKAAVITSNRMRGGIKIENKSKGKVEIGLNVDE